MFSRLFVAYSCLSTAFTALAAAQTSTITAIAAPTATTISQCPTGDAQCCNTVSKASSSPGVGLLLDLLDIALSNPDDVVWCRLQPYHGHRRRPRLWLFPAARLLLEQQLPLGLRCILNLEPMSILCGKQYESAGFSRRRHRAKFEDYTMLTVLAPPYKVVSVGPPFRWSGPD
ncbi:hypothetical protein LshimejAT787_0111770 [Lyophyllum shimeji]|uniref:Hydrophobin n=1 Tax=Lyophyllum shimeji TaxID=47721 RepID=A0A9P3PF49_LYOSH|nr:hypothetical protein LshimejAT787_0111770 [Lyophyllum shimeji]